MDLNEKNLMLFAAKHYYNHRFSDIEEINEDLKRFKYVKRLVNRYLEDGQLPERLILNHLIVIFNVFGIEPSVAMLEVKLEERQWPVIKPFLIFLKYVTNDQLIGISMDEKVVEALRKI